VKAPLMISIDSGCLHAELRRPGAAGWSAKAAFQDTADLASALAALASERPRGVRRAVVVLTPALARLKNVEGLPHLDRDNLAAHVRLNSRRYFLQNGIPLVTDAMPAETAILSDGAPAGCMLTAAPVPLIEAITDGLASAGLECDSISPAGFPALSLQLDATRRTRQAASRNSVRRWAIVATAATALAFGSWALSLSRSKNAAERELASMKPAIAQALAVQRDLDAADEALAAIARIESARTHRARFLAQLTRALPDSALVAALHLEPDGTASLSGYAPHATTVVALLERARLAQRPTIEGSVTREVMAGRDLERFSIRFQLPAEARQ
jgi:hypothetical protein